MQSRAVIRIIEPGNAASCPACGQQVKFQVRTHGRQVVCNVYSAGRWQRVEQCHLDCYSEAHEPHGPAAEGSPSRQ